MSTGKRQLLQKLDLEPVEKIILPIEGMLIDGETLGFPDLINREKSMDKLRECDVFIEEAAHPGWNQMMVVPLSHIRFSGVDNIGGENDGTSQLIAWIGTYEADKDEPIFKEVAHLILYRQYIDEAKQGHRGFWWGIVDHG